MWIGDNKRMNVKMKGRSTEQRGRVKIRGKKNRYRK